MSGRPARKPKEPVEAFDANMPDHAPMDAELVAAAESRPESPRENYTAVTTSAEGHGDAQRDLSGQNNAFPDVRLIPSGELWPHAAAVVKTPGDLRGPWRCTNGAWLTDGEVHCHGQRLVPVGPLLELVAELELAAQRAYEEAEGVKAAGLEGWAGLADGRADCAYVLHGRLARLLGTSPDSPAQEGDDG